MMTETGGTTDRDRTSKTLAVGLANGVVIGAPLADRVENSS